jgi:beta-phosphoglucomutase
MIEACIFDLDGVIVDTAKYHFLAWRRLANELGFDFTEEDNEQLKGVSRMESLDIILRLGNKTLSDQEKTDWASKKNDWYVAYINKLPTSEILPGSVELLVELRKNNIKTALGSASKNSQKILKQLNIIHLFDAIIDGTKTTESKPHPQVFLMGAEAIGVNPENCVVFEDAPKGAQAAKAGGMMCVGIGKSENLPEADFVLESLAETSLADLNSRFE